MTTQNLAAVADDAGAQVLSARTIETDMPTAATNGAS